MLPPRPPPRLFLQYAKEKMSLQAQFCLTPLLGFRGLGFRGPRCVHQPQESHQGPKPGKEPDRGPHSHQHHYLLIRNPTRHPKSKTRGRGPSSYYPKPKYRVSGPRSVHELRFQESRQLPGLPSPSSSPARADKGSIRVP